MNNRFMHVPWQNTLREKKFKLRRKCHFKEEDEISAQNFNFDN